MKFCATIKYLFYLVSLRASNPEAFVSKIIVTIGAGVAVKEVTKRNTSKEGAKVTLLWESGGKVKNLRQNCLLEPRDAVQEQTVGLVNLKKTIIKIVLDFYFEQGNMFAHPGNVIVTEYGCRVIIIHYVRQMMLDQGQQGLLIPEQVQQLRHGCLAVGVGGLGKGDLAHKAKDTQGMHDDW